MDLSQRRAESAVNYLVGKGISRERLEARGYGESRLLNACANGVTCSEEAHQANRRTEIKVLNY
jgi:outer membrane protein OmpA-like peptidoglycan-associated protein